MTVAERQKSTHEMLSILAQDMVLWWINATNDEQYHISPSFSLNNARALGVFIGQMAEAAWQGQELRVIECLKWIEADNKMDQASPETQAITEYVNALREIALAAQESRSPRFKGFPRWVALVIADETSAMSPLGHGDIPELISATGTV